MWRDYIKHKIYHNSIKGGSINKNKIKKLQKNFFDKFPNMDYIHHIYGIAPVFKTLT